MKNSVPLVSIGVPVYNGEKYLAEALDSILAQTFTDFEVIISDNASTDATATICERYRAADPRIRVYRNQVNLGAAPNYNRVFELSTGKYFKWADYDDVLEPDFLQRCVEVLNINPLVVLCYPRVHIIDKQSQVTGIYNPGPDTSSPLPHIRFCNLILHPELAIQSMGLMRRNALCKTGLHRSFPSSDEVFLAELALIGQYFEIPNRILKVRLHEEQSTRGAQAPQRARVVFFDTSLKGKITLPKWQYLLTCIKVIGKAPINFSARAYCYSQMARWTAKPAHLRALGKDALLAGQKLVARNVTARKSDVSGGTLSNC